MWFGSSVIKCRDSIPKVLGSNPGRARYLFTACYTNYGAIQSIGTEDSIALTQGIAISMAFNPFPYQPLFICIYSISLLKTLCRKKEIAHNKQFGILQQLAF